MGPCLGASLRVRAGVYTVNGKPQLHQDWDNATAVKLLFRSFWGLPLLRSSGWALACLRTRSRPIELLSHVLMPD
jgi:hypothetical protein